jgi:hypothetical protein
VYLKTDSLIFVDENMLMPREYQLMPLWYIEHKGEESGKMLWKQQER